MSHLKAKLRDQFFRRTQQSKIGQGIVSCVTGDLCIQLIFPQKQYQITFRAILKVLLKKS